MLIKQIDLTIDTSKKLEIIDITSKINDLIDIEEGIISVFSKFYPIKYLFGVYSTPF